MNLELMPSSNALQQALCREVMRSGDLVNPRGMRTRELLGVSFNLLNPRNRLTTLRFRQWSSALAIAELAWNIRGEKSVEPLAFYTPRWRDFADPAGEIRGSCYGAQIFQKNESGRSQWANIIKLLREDKNSRRAVLTFRHEHDVSASTKDLSCTNTIQFINRGGKLYAFVNMRSNDVIWGVPYDLFLFTSLQELMALELGLELGSYYHYAASMHIYERHFEMATRIAEDEAACDEGLMAAMPDVNVLQRLADAEVDLRKHNIRSTGTSSAFERLCLDLLSSHNSIRSAAA